MLVEELRCLIDDAELYTDLMRPEGGEIRIAVLLTDSGEEATLIIGEQMEVVEGSESPDLRLTMDRSVFDSVLEGEADFGALIGRSRVSDVRPINFQLLSPERAIATTEIVKTMMTHFFNPGKVKIKRLQAELAGEAHCHIGISEETIGWAGSDGNERTDPATPNMRALDGIKANADEKGLEAALKEGITTAQILPGSANVIGGTGVVVKTAPKIVVDDMVIRSPSGMKVAFGENPRRVYGVELKKTPSTRMGVAGILREWLQKAKNYREKKEMFKEDPEKFPQVDVGLEALELVLKGEIPLRVHAHRADDVATAVRIAEEFSIEMSWEHATEGHRIAEWIAEKGIPAVWGPSLTTRRKWEMRELNFDTPKVLYDAGVKLAIQTDAAGQNIAFLPLCAGMAVKHGLPYEEALKAITINSAEILGVANRVGSIEKGKDADLRILDGDPLELRTKVEMVIIDGEIVHRV